MWEGEPGWKALVLHEEFGGHVRTITARFGVNLLELDRPPGSGERDDTNSHPAPDGATAEQIFAMSEARHNCILWWLQEQ